MSAYWELEKWMLSMGHPFCFTDFDIDINEEPRYCKACIEQFFKEYEQIRKECRKTNRS